MALVIKHNHIYKAQWPVDVTRFQVKSRNKSRRNGDSVGGGRKQHIEIFLMQSKILMKSQNKSRRKISRFSEKCSGKGKVGDKSRFASTKVGRIYVCICVFYTAGSIGNSLFIYVFIHIWSGVVVFVFSYGLWFIFRGICIYVFAYYMVHGSSPHLQGSVGHGAQGNSIMCRCWWWLYAFPLLLPSLTVPHYICSITMRNRCNLTKLDAISGSLKEWIVLQGPFWIWMF